MARVPYLGEDGPVGREPEFAEAPDQPVPGSGELPNAARSFSGPGQFIRFGSKFDPRLRELAILRVGWLARSPYEWRTFTITIAFYNAVVRVLATLQIDVEDDYMPYLRQFPLPG